MGKGADEGSNKCFCCCLVLIPSVVMFACSFDTIDPKEMGLDYDGISFTLDKENLYMETREFLGLGHKFIKFPRIQRTIKMSHEGSLIGGEVNEGEESDDGGIRNVDSVRARTSDGLQVVLDLSFQYKLPENAAKLSEMYTSYGKAYEDVFIRTSRGAVRDATSRFEAFYFRYNRSLIVAEMQAEVKQMLAPEGATVDSFQLLNYELPNSFMSVIQETELAREMVQQALNEQRVAAVRAETLVREASSEAEVIILRASAEALGVTRQAEAAADSLDALVGSERKSFQKVKDALGLSLEQLQAYIWLKAFQNQPVSSVNKNIISMSIPSSFKAN